MASISHQVAFCTHFSSDKNGQEQNKHKLHCLNLHGTRKFSPEKVDNFLLSQDHSTAFTSVNPAENIKLQIQRKIPTKKEFVDRQGMIIEEGVGYRQTFVIRSCEVDPDKTATIESILNLLQETALNHAWMTGHLSDAGFGVTHGMMRNNLIWVVLRMRVQVDQYPIWGEVVEIDTWAGASGRNGMRRDWLLRSQTTGLVFARATSTWVMMNKQTRRLSKIPDEVRAEISPWLIEKQAIEEESLEKIDKLKNNAMYVHSNLKPKRSDLDVNYHVNNVKYVGWMLETIPDEFLDKHQLSDIMLEYRRECGSSHVVQSLCEPQEDGNSSSSDEIREGNGRVGSLDHRRFSYIHLLQIKGNSKDEEILRGKTTWKQKLKAIPFGL